jgi:[ribosomal protein S18]-alanine N-acetyltransferase
MTSPFAQLRIRRMSAADLERVLEIAASLQHAPQWQAAAYVKAINPENTPRRIALVAADAETDVAAGFVVANLIPPQAELETIAVASDVQRRGIGRLLFEALVEELRAEQVSTLILEVRASNRAALRFYRYEGFVETGRRPRYYADPEEDAVLMELDLG